MSFMPRGRFSGRLLGRDRNEIARFLMLSETEERRTRTPGIGRRGHEGVLRRSGLAVLRTLVLAFRSRKNGKAWPSVATLAEAANVSRSAVHEALNRLEQAGYLSRQAVSERSRAFDRRGRAIPIRRPSLIDFHWPVPERESRNEIGPTRNIENKRGDGFRPTKTQAVAAMQTWLNNRDAAKDRAAVLDMARREAETLAILAADRVNCATDGR